MPPGVKSRRSIRGTRFSNCTLVPVLTRTTSKILCGSSPAFDPEDQRLGDCHRADLAEHVVDQLHRQAVPELADMEQILAHGVEQILASGIGFRQRRRR